jgi:phosphate-selective porin OprO and OprP
MHNRISMWGGYAIALVLVAGTAELYAQDGQGYTQGYSPSVQTRLPDVNNQLQMVAADQPKTAENTPPDYSALPPAQDDSNADLVKRVEDLEKQLAKYGKAADAAKPKPSGKPVIAPSGRIQMDVANFTQNPTSVAQIGDAKNTVGFRRARLALLGEYEVIDYIIEMDFANRGVNSEVNAKDQSTGFKDVYIQVRDLPLLGNVRVGHYKECFGLEDLTSDNYTTFMERSLDDEGTFCPGRNNGIMAYNWTENQRATWAIGTFTNQTGFDQPPTFVFDQWGLDLPMRVTCLPWYDEASGGRGLLHTGLGYVYRSAPNKTMTFATRPESGFAPSVVNMTLNGLNDVQVIGTEAAIVYGPLSLQSEFFASNADFQNGTSNRFYGTYAFVSYFLTGENRPYNRKMGVFDRVRPYENFFHVRTCDDNVVTGRGAWEVAYRFSYIDMLDGLTVKGAGLATDHTFGVNWYLNPYTKVMFNYVHSIDTYNAAANNRITGGNLDILEARFAIDF